MSDKNNPSDLYDEEFLKKKEEFYSLIEDINSSDTEVEEDDGSFEELIDDFADSDLMTRLGSKKVKKEKKKSKKKKKEEILDTPEPEYDIFDLSEDFPVKEEKKPEKKKKDKKDKKKARAAAEKTPPKPREPLKPFVPHTPVEEIKADVYVKDESLYEEQNVDIDELLKNLGIPTPEEIAESERAEQQVEDISSDGEKEVKAYTGDREAMEDISSVSDEAPDFDEDVKTFDGEKDGDISGTKYFSLDSEKDEKTDVGATRHFDLKDYIRSAGKSIQEGQKKTVAFTQHFRFLKNKESDETILESAPTGKGKDSMMDSVKADEGEDIFEAVEKAQKKKKRHRLNTSQNFISLQDYDEKLNVKLKKEKKKLIFALVAFAVSAVLTVPFSAYGLQGAHHGLIYGLLHILAVALICVLAKNELTLGFNNIRYLSPDENSVTFIVAVFVMLFDIITVALGTSGVSGVKPYTLCLAFSVLVRFAGSYLDDLAARKSVKALSEKGEYEGIHYISNKNDALVVAHGLSEKTVPTVIYGAESRVDAGIREDKAPRKDEEKFYSFTAMAVLLVGFVAGIILFTRNKDAVSFITPLVSCVCFCLPVMNELVSSIIFCFTSSHLSERGVAVNDRESLETLSQAKALSADAKELFTCEVSSFRRVKGSHISKSDAAVFAAAALKAGGSMAGDCFTDFVDALGITLPEASDLQYEEKLGFACWVADRRVLVGNRQMLTEHSIDAPTQAEEKAYAGKKSVMYVAVEGQLVATFLVKYRVVPAFRKIAHAFEKTGFVLLVSSKEPCLDESKCAERLSLDVISVKIISQKAADIVASYRKDSEKGKATALVCLKSKCSLAELAVKAHGLYSSDRLASSLLLSGQAVALVLTFLSVFLNMPLFRSPFAIVILQSLWAFGCYAVVSADFRKKVKKTVIRLIGKVRKSK
ncbi:MAG: hypothetical protein IJO73_09480 [Clostridia bacterium]|nr:hypothetical protein [Clostridia bacterium]